MNRRRAFGGKNPWWTPCQVKIAVEAQLDREVAPKERKRRLERVADKIEYRQQRNQKAAYYHDKRRRRQLREAGIDLRKVRRCPIRI